MPTRKAAFFFPGLILALSLLLAALPAGALAAGSVPPPDEIYTAENNWEGTLVISESKTVKLSNLTHDHTDTNYLSPIKITNGATVNLVIEGSVTLTAHPNKISAGIEVEEGSTLNLYGADGSSLTVTGGQISAGIGGIGQGSVSATNPKAGNINIFSGNITATGGNKGAGIGSGEHSSASDIHIWGGSVTAYGKGGGAGIGSGYGTSGGAAIAAGVGFYSGVNITISGGTVRAAATPEFDFDRFHWADQSTWPQVNTFAAGIGGGYGASSGGIVIEGDAEVTAVGSCGGAGIGTGRGTTKMANYDANHADLSVTIRENAQVTACTTTDSRENMLHISGAGIGLGAHFDSCGSVSIEGSASVQAAAGAYAEAIGGGFRVMKLNSDADFDPSNIASPQTNIAPSATVKTISDGFVPVSSDPAKFDVAALFSRSFSFTKKWEGGVGESIDYALCLLGGDAFDHVFEKTGISETEWRFDVEFPALAACYLVETPVDGFSTRYENTDVYARLTDCCYNGGTIINKKIPKTGDEAPLTLWAGALLLGMAGFGAALAGRKRGKASR